jgi:hypothetical protein
VLAPLAVAGVALAACGGSSPSAASSSTSSTTAGAASQAAFRTCLQQHGVTLPSRPTGSGGFPGAGGGGGGGFPGAGGTGAGANSSFAQAFQACASLRPAGSGRGFAGGGTGASSLALKTYVNCLSIHGVTIPSSGTAETTALRQLFTDPTTKDKAAETACASLRPSFGGRPGTTSTTTTTVA